MTQANTTWNTKIGNVPSDIESIKKVLNYHLQTYGRVWVICNKNIQFRVDADEFVILVNRLIFRKYKSVVASMNVEDIQSIETY